MPGLDTCVYVCCIYRDRVLCIDQAGLEITEISLTLPFKCWDQRCALPHQAIFIFILFSLIFLLAIGNIFSYSYS